MPTAAAIDRALENHGKWVGRLMVAIHTGVTEFPIATIRSAHDCEFGAWLDGNTLTETEKRSLEYSQVVDLHAHFHNIAGRVVELAMGGNRADAEELLSRDFDTASKLLVAAMIAWKERAQAEARSAAG